jgi:hypothetical protein
MWSAVHVQRIMAYTSVLPFPSTPARFLRGRFFLPVLRFCSLLSVSFHWGSIETSLPNTLSNGSLEGSDEMPRAKHRTARLRARHVSRHRRDGPLENLPSRTPEGIAVLLTVDSIVRCFFASGPNWLDARHEAENEAARFWGCGDAYVKWRLGAG